MNNSFCLGAAAFFVLNAALFAQSPYTARDYNANRFGTRNPGMMSGSVADLVATSTNGQDKEAPKEPPILPVFGSASDFQSAPSCLFGDSSNPPSCPRIWVRGEYLLWWLSAPKLPPLVTTSPPGTPQIDAGVLGSPGTAVLFGDSHVNGDVRSGGRVTLGGWLGC